MFLKRISIFLLVAFLIVDAVLLTFYLKARNHLLVISDKMIENTLMYYESNGVKIGKNVIKPRIPENAIYTFDSSNIELSPEIAEKMSGKLFSETSTVSFAETPDGISYSISNKGIVEANFRVYRDTFRFEYLKGDFVKDSVSFILPTEFKNEKTVLSYDTEKVIEKFLKSISLKNDNKYTVSGISQFPEGTYVCIKSVVCDKYTVENMYINFYIKDKELVYADGNWIFSGFKKSYVEELTDGINVLGRINMSTVSTVVSEEIIYMYRSAGSGRYYLIPMWKIEYIDINGNKKIQYVDAIKI